MRPARHTPRPPTRRLAALALLLLLAAGCQTADDAPRGEGPIDSDVRRLARWMTGTFDSAEQAAADETYFTIRLVMLPIWTDRTDGRWLYVEQAADGSLDQPYRQRVYRLHGAGRGVVWSEVYILPGDPRSFAGWWDRDDAHFDTLAPDDLTRRVGCSIRLTPDGPDLYVGETIGDDCESTLRGADYATSEVLITEHELLSWDRGWTRQGEQAWGAVNGPYIFIKKSNGPPA